MANENDPINDEDLREYCENIQLFIKGGLTVDAAVARLQRIYGPNPELSAAETLVKRMLNQHGLDGDLSKFITLVEEREEGSSWYVGPDLNIDTYWPPVRLNVSKAIGQAVESVDKSSTAIIQSLRPANGSEFFNLKGLVVGYVQSGKTTNFMSVIAKAADVGYRLIIVLTGMTENLRVQTQARLEQQLILNDHGKWHRLTTIDHDFWGDDNPQRLKDPDTRFIAVVKKNTTRLKALNRWIAQAGMLGDSCPILVIDDEADQASIDVSPRAKGRRSAINQQISDLLAHRKTVYIGYTATPFANVLINPNKTDDLYPSNFIHVLPEPDGYFGAEALFGRDPLDGEERSEIHGSGHDMIRIIADSEVEKIKPPTSRKASQDWSAEIGFGLRDAIRWFIMATAARWIRGDKNKHSSMLVHTSMLTEHHLNLEYLITQEINELRSTITANNIPPEWLEQWESETSAVTASEFDLEPVSFNEIKPRIPEVLSKIRVIVDNAESDDRLIYTDEEPETVIAIGGNTLSRGLTLEGLISSYFVRQASAFDTLLQMGRWFGFRNGYQDLPRIWMPAELALWFRDLALIETDLRQELAVYAREGSTPIQVQAKIRKHPAMMITARAKMQDSINMTASFSGQQVQTVRFKAGDKEWLQNNLDATWNFVESLQSHNVMQEKLDNGTTVFRSAPTETVLKFLSEYEFDDDFRLGSRRGALIRDYIQNELNAKTLGKWNISFFGLASEAQGTREVGPGLFVHKVRRSKLKNETTTDAQIRALAPPLHRLNDLPVDNETRHQIIADVTSKVKENPTRRDAVIRATHDDYAGIGTAHLAIYVINKDSKAPNPPATPKPLSRHSISFERVDLNAVDDVIGIAIFFPTSANRESGVEYVSAVEPDAQILEAYEALDDEYASAEASDGKKLEDESSDRA
ncbi:Z1 domain-containing protein [Corynebacterium freiburgense]|uniref:Z1 domain-containing protein n=1 Tax=Corynebacterium freiburgense TaxID=556548 RepID=UPI0003F8BBB7|nr:Z1 domain-containing protein [Corynebacterium freiburgense]WJZ02323.1 Z1 domain protein [Corynebacterium freiburgense]